MTNHIIKTITVLTFLMIPALAAGQGIAEEKETEIHMPSFSELEEGWNTMKPGGETSCAHGTDFQFYVRPGSSKEVLVYLYGGGGCWDAEGCVTGSNRYTQEVWPGEHPPTTGIFDLNQANNPFRGFTTVAVPVCTGDVHLGQNDATYVLDRDDEETLEFIVRHRGQVNTGSAVQWVIDNLPGADRIAVLGSSAGALGVPFHVSVIAQALPNSDVVGLSDDGGSYGAQVMGNAAPENWGLPRVLNTHPGWEMVQPGMDVVELFTVAGQSAENLRLFQFDHSHDRVQHYFIEQAGTADPDIPRLLRDNRAAIQANVPAFRSYTTAGYPHTVLRHPVFYHLSTQGVGLADWVTMIIDGHEVEDVSCTQCIETEFAFSDTDHMIIQRVLELLADESDWNRNDPGGPCPDEAESLSLRCAVARAAESAVGTHAVPWAVAYATAARVPYHREGWSPLNRFNNDPETSHADVLGLLTTIADRVSEALVLEAAGHDAE